MIRSLSVLTKIFTQKSIIIITLVFLFSFGLFTNPQATNAQADITCTQTSDCNTGFSCVNSSCIADAFGTSDIGENTNLSTQDIRVTIGRIIQVVLSLMGIVLLVLIIYAGVTIMTAGGNADKVITGKKILTNAVVGLIIIMSAMGITQFIISRLAGATGSGGFGSTQTDGSGSGAGGGSSFFSSGSLGNIVKETYPAAGDRDVKRNSKIVVTFAESINPESFIENTNNTCWNEAGTGPTTTCTQDNDGNIINPYYGDCLSKASLDFTKDCDQVKTDSVMIYERSKKDAEPLPVSGAMALAIYKAKDEAEVFTFKPTSLLGSDKENTWYRVDLTDNITKKDGGSAFSNILGNKYTWEFETGVTADLTPPQVVSINPKANSTIARNIILQISFDEPIDPSVAQGIVGPNSSFNHIIFKNKDITGQWKILNGYKTIEFVSDQQCGQNSCGENMYCLPVPSCTQGDKSCIQKEEILLRSGELVSTGQQTFDAKPFSGITDMAGNALDGNKNDKPDNRPAITSAKVISTNETDVKKDNVWIKLNIQNNIDLSVPHIESVTPDIDAQGVSGDKPIEIIFSNTMQYSTLFDGVRVEEYPEIKDEKGEVKFFWNKLSISEKEEKDKKSQTKALISHRDFSPAGEDVFYFVSVSSTVKGANGNCLYPGRGPKSSGSICKYEKGTVEDGCLPADGYSKTGAATNDTGCAVSQNGFDTTQADVAACIGALKKDVDVLLNNANKN